MKAFKHLLSILILEVIMLSPSFGNGVKNTLDPALNGFWEGQLPLGKEYILVLYINSEKADVHNFIQLFKSGVRQSNDQIDSIELVDGFYSFKIKSVNGLYKFKRNEDTLKGIIFFPNGNQAKVHFIKVDKPSIGDFSNIKSPPKINLLTYKYENDKILEDYDFFIKSIKENQPNLYTFSNKKDFEALISATRKKLNRKFTQMEFLRIITVLTERIGCGHLGVGPSAEISQYIDRVRFVPFFIKIIEGKVYIGENYIDKLKDKSGVELLSINGRNIDDILAEIINGLPVDGRNLSSKIAVIEQNFPILYINHIEAADHYKIEYKSPQTGESGTIELEGLKFGHFPKEYYANHPDKIPNSFPVTLKLKDKKIAIIKVTQFYYKDFDIFYHSIDSMFNKIRKRKINNLIIDLRGNSGGDPRLSFYLLTKIAQDDFIYFKSPEELKKVYPALFSKRTVDSKHFKGRVFVLMDGACKSTAAHFLSIVKFHDWAKLVGRETGATFYCNAGTKDLILPNTKIKLVQPTIEVITNVNEWDKLSPLKPDYQVKYTYEDLLKNSDPDLEFTFKLINDNE